MHHNQDLPSDFSGVATHCGCLFECLDTDWLLEGRSDIEFDPDELDCAVSVWDVLVGTADPDLIDGGTDRFCDCGTVED